MLSLSCSLHLLRADGLQQSSRKSGLLPALFQSTYPVMLKGFVHVC